MNPSDSDISPTSPASTASQGAYLVLRAAGRWSDVFRLVPPAEAVIGRASSNQIVIRTDQASRRHARIFWGAGQWMLEDLGSRNGTFLNGKRLEATNSLADGDLIEVGGYAITFARRIDGGLGEPAVSHQSSQATDDQLTMEMDADAITDRRRQSRYLHGPGNRSAAADGKDVSRLLLHLAFALARCEKSEVAVEAVLDLFSQQISFDTAGIYLWGATKTPSSLSELPLVATRQSGPRSYRRPPDGLVETLAGEESQAILARNVAGDEQLATENSRGEIDVESVILAPMRDRDRVLRGLIHLTTSANEPPLGSEDLELVVAAAEILAESLSNLSDRKRLSRSLRRSRKQVEQLQQQLGDKVRIVGQSRAIAEVVEQISMAAPTNATVLVRGESGVGKELVAAALHHASGRKEGPLICLNCAALSPALLESELFGHEKGAFTGATDRKRGKFEAADGGTLMLDEIGEMSAEIQAKFLRVLEGHPFERVGGHEAIRVDVRVVAATNRDLQAMVRDGKFRQDLYYRLHVVEILVPPLRQRGEDCLHLAQYFLDRFNTEMGRKIQGFTDAAKKRLVDYNWPGNIRELRNVIERAVVLNTKPKIDASDLVLSPAMEAGAAEVVSQGGSAEMTLAQIEREHIERVLRHTGGNKSRAASILGIERSTLDRKLKRFASD
ncbi:MAG: sigma 54-interacting transcriptional regulator [Pirellulales bacterium]|nr:sigma 54-interacting transcriptional regulator [Pirellulales bacterium]